MKLSFFLSFILSFVFAASVAQARKGAAMEEFAPDDTPIVRLMSHAELMKLDDKSRERYLENVRLTILHYDKTMAVHFGDEKAASIMRELWKTFWAVDANAAEGTSPGQGEGAPQADPDFRCIYAGWVATGRKCEPKKQTKYNIYNTWECEKNNSGIKGPCSTKIAIDLKCEGGKILCNPVVFGVERPTEAKTPLKDEADPKAKAYAEKHKPICVSAGTDKRNTSRECYYEARAKKAVADEKYNPELWREFKSGYDKMCGESGVSGNRYFQGRARATKDMKDTCEWIKRQLDGNSAADPSGRGRYNPNADNQRGDERGNEGLR